MAIIYGLKSLLRFSGRDPRRRFWPYAGLIVALSTAAMMAGMMPIFATTFANAARFAEEHPDQTTVTRTPTSYSVGIAGDAPGVFPDMTTFFAIMGAGAAVMLLLLAAAVVRRLHDRNRSGLWTLPFPVFFGVGIFGFAHLWTRTLEGEEPLGLFGLIFVNNMLYIGALILLIIQLAQPGTPGENRFGPPSP